MSRQHLSSWCAAWWTQLRNGFGGASLSLAIQAQLPAQGQALAGATLTGDVMDASLPTGIKPGASR